MKRRFSHLPFALCLTIAAACWAAPARAESPVKLNRSVIMVDDLEAPSTPLTIEGNASHLGKFTGKGEITFVDGEEWSAFDGAGPVVLVAANGDRLAGVIEIEIYPFDENGEAEVEIHISWKDSVTIAGSLYRSTGRFAKTRPPGVITRGIGSHQWISIPLCIVTK